MCPVLFWGGVPTDIHDSEVYTYNYIYIHLCRCHISDWSEHLCPLFFNPEESTKVTIPLNRLSGWRVVVVLVLVLVVYVTQRC